MDESRLSVVMENVTKRFGKVVAVENISMKVKYGELFVLAGPNGSGKSTLLNIITGFLKPNSGRVIVFNKPPNTLSAKERRKIGFLHESLGLPLNVKVSVYLDAVAEYRGCNTAQEIIELLNLKTIINKKIGALSMGYKKRVGLAGALLCNPELVLLDEPYSNVDPETRELIDSILVDLRNKSTVIISTHVFPSIDHEYPIMLLMNGKHIGNTTSHRIIVYILDCNGDIRKYLDPMEVNTSIRDQSCKLITARYATISELIHSLGTQLRLQ